jgi:alpha-tubulin suppressor-like RCC1 family protein
MRTRRLAVVLASVLAAGCIERAEVLGPAPRDDRAIGAIADVALGDAHGCAVSAARLYCWGDNEFGQLGLGDTLERHAPTLLDVDGSFRQVTAGARHSCALDDLGRVACWGDNDRGQLGVGDRDPRSVPTFVTLTDRAALVTSDFTHTCAVLRDATLYCWGKNDEGELGQDDPFPGDQSTDADALEPVAVPGSYRAVETGQGHTCAIRLDGTLWCWGRNSEHELGESNEIQIRVPIQVGIDDDWLGVEAGQSHTSGLRQDLSAYSWGQNTGFAAGGGAPLGVAGATLLETPTLLDAPNQFTLLRSDTFHACALDRDAQLFCWGRNNEGQLGLGDDALREIPSLVGSGFLAVSVGRFGSCAVSSTGSLSCTGKNDSGELGTGDTAPHATFTPVVFPSQ